MRNQHSQKDRRSFYLLAAVVAGLAFWLIRPYLDVIAFSLLAVIILKPLYDVMLRWTGRRAGLATLATLAAFFLAIIVPLWFAGRVAGNQLQQIAADVQQPGGVEALSDEVSAGLRGIAGQDVELSPEQLAEVEAAVSGAAQRVAAAVINLGMSIPSLLARLFIFLGIVGVLLPGYEGFVKRIKRLSPLDDVVDDLFLQRIKLTVWAMFIAIFVIAVVQGLVTGLFIWIAGVPYTPLWTMLAVVAAMLPLGASLIAIPLGIAQILIGEYTAGVIILAGYILVVSNIDTFIRPRLVPKEAYLNFALVLISALSGYTLFGFFGVVYGPVLMIICLTVVEVYETYYAGDEQPARAVGAEPVATVTTIQARQEAPSPVDGAKAPTALPERPELPDAPTAG